MSSDLRQALERAILSGMSLEEVVAILRQYKAQGVTRDEVYSLLDALRATAPNEAADDRILEVSDYVAGFCSPHMNVWDE